MSTIKQKLDMIATEAAEPTMAAELGETIAIPQAEYKRLVEALEESRVLVTDKLEVCVRSYSPNPSGDELSEIQEAQECLDKIDAALKAAREGGKA